MTYRNYHLTKLLGPVIALASLMLWLALPTISSRCIEVRASADAALHGPATEPQKRPECWSATGQPYPCGAAVPAGIKASGIDLSADGVCKVAIFDQEIFFAQGLATVLNSDPTIQATVVSQSTVESGGLAGFDAIAARLFGFVTTATIQSIQSFVASGHGYVGEWWGAGAALSGLGAPANFNYIEPSQFLNIFTGLASDGFFIETNHPITVTASHPVVAGMPGVFAAEGGTEFFVRAIPPFDSRLTVLATYAGYGGTNPAIMAGSAGSANVVLLFFDAIDNPADPNLKRLWINSVKFACVGSGFDLCIQDESSAATLKINSTTGAYLFTSCSGSTIGGTGTLVKRGSTITLQHYAGDRRVLATIDTALNKGTASIQIFSPGSTFTIGDRNTTNNTCSCP